MGSSGEVSSGEYGGSASHRADDATAMRPEKSKKTTHIEIKKWLEKHCRMSNLSGSEEQAYSLLNAVDEWWSFEAATRQGLKNFAELADTLADMKSGIARMESKLDKKDSYASVAKNAAKSSYQAGSTQTITTKRALEDERKLRTCVVSVADPKEKANVRLEHTKDLLDKVNRAIGQDGKPAGVRRLQSGDLEFQMASVTDRKKMEAEAGWTKVIAGSASVRRRTYAVMAHGVRMSNINMNDQGAAISGLIAQNKSLHKDLRITKVSWLKSAIEAKKLFSSLIIETTSPNHANAMIKQGLVEDHEVKICTAFHKNIQLGQCFKCYEYGHFARNCKATAKCGKCAKGHETDKCTETGRCCAVCKTPGHEAWSKQCLVRREHMGRLDIVRAAQPMLYAEEAPSPPPCMSPQIRGRKRDRALSISSGSPTPESMEEGNTDLEVPSSCLTSEWKKAFMGRASGPPAKRNYTHLKINRSHNVIEDDAEL